MGKDSIYLGLHQRIVELVTIANPIDLNAAINYAEKVEMACNLALGSQQGQRIGDPYKRGRISFSWGRGHFGAIKPMKVQQISSGGQ